jgi:hypothetical protein
MRRYSISCVYPNPSPSSPPIRTRELQSGTIRLALSDGDHESVSVPIFAFCRELGAPSAVLPGK